MRVVADSATTALSGSEVYLESIAPDQDRLLRPNAEVAPRAPLRSLVGAVGSAFLRAYRLLTHRFGYRCRRAGTVVSCGHEHGTQMTLLTGARASWENSG